MGTGLVAMGCHRYVSLETVIPCHYGTFPMIDQTAEKFVAAMGGTGVVVPERG